LNGIWQFLDVQCIAGIIRELDVFKSKNKHIDAIALQ